MKWFNPFEFDFYKNPVTILIMNTTIIFERTSLGSLKAKINGVDVTPNGIWLNYADLLTAVIKNLGIVVEFKKV